MRTLVSRTARSAVIRQQLVEHLLGEASRARLQPHSMHGLQQTGPRGTPHPLVVLDGQHDCSRSALFGDGHRFALRGFEELAAATLGVDGRDAFTRNSCFG